MLCTHSSLAQAYKRLTNKAKCLRHLTAWIDEAQHVLVAERQEQDHAYICNLIGNLVKYMIDMDDDTARVGLATAFFFLGDNCSIVPETYLKKFGRYTLPLDKHWETNIQHIESFKYDFVIYKGSYVKDIKHLFKKRLGKTIVYVPWPNASVSQGCKYKETKRIITAIKSVRPSARILNLVDETDREEKREMFYTLDVHNNVDVIIAMGMLREGADWIWADRVIDLAPSNSLSLCGQKFGRLIRDVPGKKRIEYYTFLPFVVDTLDEDTYRRRLSERFAAFTASLLIEDIVTPVKLPMSNDKKDDQKDSGETTTSVNIFEHVVPDENARQKIFNLCCNELIRAAADNEDAVERGERTSNLPTPVETDEVIVDVLKNEGVKKHLEAVCRHIKLVLTRSAMKRPAFDISRLVDDWDTVNRYVYKSIMMFGAGVCNCSTFASFRNVLNKTIFYRTLEEWRAAVKRLGIKSNPEYRRRFREDPRLHSNPDVYFKMSWAELIGYEHPQFYETVEEWRDVVVGKMGIKTHEEYTKRYKEDPRLVRNAERHYGMKWNALMGRPEKYKDIQKFIKAIAILGIASQKQYSKRYKEDPRLPAQGPFYYGMNWNQMKRQR